MPWLLLSNKYLKIESYNKIMSNTNSFAGNMSKLTDSVSKVLSVVEGMNEAMLGNEEEVKISDDTTLPSLSNISKRITRAENTISKFVQGKGVIETDDGTYRKIKVTNVSRPPETISNLDSITTFSINPNWFFESLQYPRCVVKIDLTNKIPDTADRVLVNRVIINANDNTTLGRPNSTVYSEAIAGQNLGYAALLNILNENGMSYSEDRDEVKLPLTYEKYVGSFGITDTRLLKDSNGNSKQWYFLDMIDYDQVDKDGLEVTAGNILKAGDYLRFNNSLYKVAEVEQDQKRVRLDYAVGYETLGVGDILELYNEPFSSKEIEVGIGINEYDIIYVKAVNEDFNLLANNWSAPIMFYTNELIFDEQQNLTLEDYHSENVADFGQQLISQVKEGQIYAIDGKQPNAPVLNADDLKVVQINTQLDATLDKETYNKLTTEIASAKSNISAVRNTISANKDLLIQSTTADERKTIQTTISSDTNKLNSLTTQYNSLVNELNTLLNESGAISYSPKYHIRGFFNIPESKYTNEYNLSGEQVVVGFEILYRYLHTDESGITLNTFEYTDDNDTRQTGVFTDWNLTMSSTLAKVYNSEKGLFEWKSENPSDGSQININQIDIPIRSGEKVEIKVRSISEAGYPYNPLKSEWSNSVIISFPDNLTSDDNVSTMLDSAKSDLTAVTLQETMSAAGLYTHIADSNSTYKHDADNIAYTTTSGTQDSSSGISYQEISVQDELDTLHEYITKRGLRDSSADSSIYRLENVVTNIDASLGKLESKDASLDASIKLLDNEITNIKDLINSGNNNEIDTSINSLEKDMANVKKFMLKKDTRDSSADASISLLENTMVDVQKFITNETNKDSSTDASISTLEKELTSIKDTVSKINNGDTNVSESISSLIKRVSPLEDYITEIKNCDKNANSFEDIINTIISKWIDENQHLIKDIAKS